MLSSLWPVAHGDGGKMCKAQNRRGGLETAHLGKSQLATVRVASFNIFYGVKPLPRVLRTSTRRTKIVPK